MITSLAVALLLAGTDQAGRFAAASSTCASFPLRSTGIIHYVCDCQAGAQPGCVAGNDASDGLSLAHPKRTWGAAIDAFNAMDAGDTVALCRGGAFTVTSTSPWQCSNNLTNPRCAAGSSLTDPANTSTCDLRDYAPSWGGTARPILLQPFGSDSIAINRFNGSVNGVRVLNLRFQGGNPGPGYADRAAYSDLRGIASGYCNVAHDASWLICNDEFDRLHLAMNPANGESTYSSFVIQGNRFTMNDLDALLLGNGDDNRIDANLFDDNGGFTNPMTGNGGHSVYLAGNGIHVSKNVAVVNNEFRRSGAPATPPGPNATGVLVGHEYYEDLLVENNLVDAGAGARQSGWNIDLNNQAAASTCLRSTIIRGNRILGGGLGINLTSSPDAVIEDNAISLVNAGGQSNWNVGISAPSYVANATSGHGDCVGDRVTIRNNSIYISAPSGGAYTGIVVDGEGTGHVIANNAVHFDATASSLLCFRTPLAASAYAFVGNNACFGGTWDTTYDATTHLTADPLFVSPPGDLALQPTSPLLGAGDPAHASAVDFFGGQRPSVPAIGAYDLGGGTSSGGTSSGGTSSGGTSSSGGGGCGTSGALPGALAAIALLGLTLRRRKATTP